jgi:hypothetical protein
MTKNRWQQYKEKNGVTPLDLLNPMTKPADKELAKLRLETCLSCPELIKTTKQCKKCGCLMTVKTKLEAAKCPMGKW